MIVTGALKCNVDSGLGCVRLKIHGYFRRNSKGIRPCFYYFEVIGGLRLMRCVCIDYDSFKSVGKSLSSRSVPRGFQIFESDNFTMILRSTI